MLFQISVINQIILSTTAITLNEFIFLAETAIDTD